MSIIPPQNRDPLALFEYSVRKVISLGMMNEAKPHQAWANLIFGYEKKSYDRSDLMSIVKHEFSQYFNEELQYRFLEERIKMDFPYLFGIEEDQDIFVRMLRALESECIQQKDPRNQKVYKVASCVIITIQDKKYIFKAQLEVDEGEDPHFTEGVSFELRTAYTIYYCEVVEFDYANALLFFSCVNKITLSHDSRVVSDATMNTIALMKLLKEISERKIDSKLPLYKLLNSKTKQLSSVVHGAYPAYIDDYLSGDESQYKAFKAALDKDITFIWGPPGTGKSYTLAAIIMALYHMKGERTAVCCLSNVAVDQLLRKVVDIIEVEEPEMTRGEFYRAGRTEDNKLIATDFLYPDDEKSIKLRTIIKLAAKKIETYKKINEQYSDEAIAIKAKIKDTREELKEHTGYLIGKVKVVFSTIANFVINPLLKDGEFDNIIVDEASMLAKPQLIALARKVKKRIILVGDFQQLAPISTAGVPILRENVFKMCGIDIAHTCHPALHQLLNQRRSNPKIVDIINHSFYADRLKAQNSLYDSIVAGPPYSGNVVGMYCVDNGTVKFTRGGTRQNIANADAVMNLLDMYSEGVEEIFSIGVITPYTGQVALLKALFSKKEYNTDFQDRVKIGTVHTFQGSESDVIIFDMVDCLKFEKDKTPYFGRIYGGEEGEQLLNVAISRAKHKLIVVCDPECIKRCPGGKVSDRTKTIFNSLLKSRWTKI